MEEDKKAVEKPEENEDLGHELLKSHFARLLEVLKACLDKDKRIDEVPLTKIFLEFFPGKQKLLGEILDGCVSLEVNGASASLDLEEFASGFWYHNQKAQETNGRRRAVKPKETKNLSRKPETRKETNSPVKKSQMMSRVFPIEVDMKQLLTKLKGILDKMSSLFKENHNIVTFPLLVLFHNQDPNNLGYFSPKQLVSIFSIHFVDLFPNEVEALCSYALMVAEDASSGQKKTRRISYSGFLQILEEYFALEAECQVQNQKI